MNWSTVREILSIAGPEIGGVFVVALICFWAFRPTPKKPRHEKLSSSWKPPAGDRHQ